MSEVRKSLSIQHAELSDRGLNERRPLNEDSFLADGSRNIFAVADGVGGAEAGEVASQTAIEVLDEAFRHQLEGADIEDLMELAIQRANSSIHQMAQDHAKFSMMATTIVALHLNGNLATIGHVGDSRLYRLAVDGQLVRETEDHSVVEEEVRAGRMTPEQAANHPSKNVISRALGADEGVEVDMKTMEVEDGTEFLLCTDGITRHISDSELRHLLILNDDLDKTCKQLKDRCYERGAEDNLTVVIIRVGNRIPAEQRNADLDPMIAPETEARNAEASTDGRGTSVPRPQNGLIPPSRIAFPDPRGEQAVQMPATAIHEPIKPSRSGLGVFGFILSIALIALAFLAGARYRDRLPFFADSAKATQQPVATPTPVPEEPFVKFEKARREVDRDPRGWLSGEVGKELVSEGVLAPLESTNPEFLYLYGRASLQAGNTDEAAKAFENAITKTQGKTDAASETIRRDATLALAAVSLKTFRDRNKAIAHYDELTKPAPSAP